MSETKPCIACAEEIKAEAKLCRFCNTNQNSAVYAEVAESEELKSGAKKSSSDLTADSVKSGSLICPTCGSRASQMDTNCSLCGRYLAESQEKPALGEVRTPSGTNSQSESAGTTSAEVLSSKTLTALGIGAAFILVLIVMASAGNSGGGGGASNPGQQGGSGRWESKCTSVYVYRTDISTYEALKRGEPSGSWQRQCTDVWVED